MFFVVQREDCKSFAPAKDIDPEYAKALSWAAKNGVKISAWKCRVNPMEIALAKPIVVSL